MSVPPPTDWHDRAAAEAAWDAYLDEYCYRDGWGIYSVKHLMKRQRDWALGQLKRQGYDVPIPPDPYAEWWKSGKPPHTAPRLGDWGREWLEPELLAKLSLIPPDVVERAWQEGAKKAIDVADDMYHIWSTDSF